MSGDMVGRPFEADLDVSDGRVVVAFRGELDMAAKEAAAAALAAALSADPDIIVVDLRGLSFMDSTGINCLIRAKSMAEPLGRRMALLNGSGQPHHVLELTRLVEAFEMVQDLPAEQVAAEP